MMNNECTAVNWPIFGGTPEICGAPMRRAFTTTDNYRACSRGHVTPTPEEE